MITSLLRRVIPAVLLMAVCSTATADDLEVQDFFKAGIYQKTTLSPDGLYLAFERNRKVYVSDRAGDFYRVFTEGREEINAITWIGDRTLVIETRGRRSMSLTAVRFLFDPDGGEPDLQTNVLDVTGYIHDPLINDPDRVLFASYVFDDDSTSVDIYNVAVFENPERQIRRKNRLKTGSRDFFYYLRDKDGNYVSGVERREEGMVIWHLPPGEKKWVEVRTIPTEKTFLPYGVTADRKLIAKTNQVTDRTAVVAIDLTGAEPDAVLFEHPRYDLARLVFSREQDRLIAAGYLETGSPKLEFLDEDAKAEFEILKSQFPERNVVVTDTSKDRESFLLRVSSPTDRGSLYLCGRTGDDCQEIGMIAPWLDGVDLGRSIALDVASTDGLVIESYLTLPPGDRQQVPLIVMPHGGPIGVQDYRAFSGDVQWLAYSGYAVLQVNYRGSSGYGKAFLAAGLQEWGRGIEDDIEASVDRVLQDYPEIDGDRVGLFGGSYGGYSALMGVIRNPSLYKCAVSFAGVTDLSLVFAQGRIKRNESLRNLLIDIVGDPDEDSAELRANSPVYRYRDISRPVMLAHGTEDNIVDIEHLWRMYKLMRLTDMRPEVVVMNDVGHGFRYLSEVSDFYGPLMRFLEKHL